MTQAMPKIMLKYFDPEQTTRVPQLPQGQTTNQGTELKCTAPDGSIRSCMDSSTFAKTPATAAQWPHMPTKPRATRSASTHPQP